MTMNTPRTVFFIAAAFSTVAIAANAQSARQCSVILELGPDAVSNAVHSACAARYANSNAVTRNTNKTPTGGVPTPNTTGIYANVGHGQDTSLVNVEVSRDTGIGVSVGRVRDNDPVVDVGLGRDAEGSLADVSVNDGGVSASVGGVDVSVGGGGGGLGGLLD